MSQKYSPYYDEDSIVAGVSAGGHRDLIGGLWEEIGPLQLQILQDHGLEPRHRLLDIGCGSLRGGVHFVRYLDAGNYWGTDLNRSLLDAGYDVEIRKAGLQDRLSRDRLAVDEDFSFQGLGDGLFDRALAFSVFTHLPLNSLRVCLERLAPRMKEGGIFYATYFELPEGTASGTDVTHQPGGIVTHGDADPYHYRVEDIEHAARDLPWRVEIIREFGHPRAQRLAAFVRMPDRAPTRRLAVTEAAALEPGSDHYRAYVGPPGRFDILSASQFALLFQLGLRDRHKVLDFGCGSLRLGRLLIPFLNEKRYFGIDPNRWLIEEGLERELGRDAARIKKPRFSYNEDFDCSVFAEPFDFIVAQSIITHTGPDLLDRMLPTVAPALAERGLFLFSYIHGSEDAELPPDGWHYPGCVAYGSDYLDRKLSEVGLIGAALPWFHPGATWYMAARTREALPTQAALAELSGRIVHDMG